MPARKLQKGLFLDNVEIPRPSVNTSPGTRFTPSRLPGRKPLAVISSGNAFQQGNQLVPIHGITIKGKALASQFTAQQMALNTVRFMQFIRHREFSAIHAGTKDADGATVFMEAGKGLNTWFLDCLVNNSGTPVNFPFYNNTNVIGGIRDFQALLNDSPGARYETDERNNKTGDWNYLFRIRRLLDFHTCLVFVHADGTREALRSMEWTVDLSLQCHWVGGQPKLKKVVSRVKLASADKETPPEFRNFVANPNALVLSDTVNQHILSLPQDGFNGFATRDYRTSIGSMVDDANFWTP